MGSQNINAHSQNETNGFGAEVSHAPHHSFWNPFRLEMKHGFFTTFLNPSNSHCKFDDDDEMQEEVMTWFKGQAASF
jgi:hypothetical protein